MMRGLLRRGTEREFRVELHVYRLNSIPVTHRILYVQWRMSRRESSNPHYGITKSRPVEAGNFVEWNAPFTFHAHIAADPADPDYLTLQSTLLRLELRSERRSRIGIPGYNTEGFIDIDLAEVAGQGTIERNMLVQQSLVNATLHFSLQMTQITGNKVFRPRTAAVAAAAEAGPSVPPEGLQVANPAPMRSLRRNESWGRLAALEPLQQPCLSQRTGAMGMGGRTATLAAMGAGRAATMSARKATMSGRGRTASIASSALRPMPSYSSAASASTRSGNTTFVGGVDALPVLDMLQDRSPLSLEGYAPDSNEVQADVYDKVLWERLRDDWPERVTVSRGDSEAALAAVEDIFADVFQATALPSIENKRTSSGGSQSSLQNKIDETKMTVEGLLKTLYHAPPKAVSRPWRSGDSQDDAPGSGPGASESVEKKSVAT